MTIRRGARIRGVVQGVGFRPHVARLATDLCLAGWIRNGAGLVELEVEGDTASIERFGQRLTGELPEVARIDELQWHELAPTGERDFRIDESRLGQGALAIPPDLGVCAECLDEVADAKARRHGYPFTNCTRCGPRFTITEQGPYDRERTSMAGFEMCRECAQEYGSAGDRRYHAQPIACPRCGPQLRLEEADGRCLAAQDKALDAAVAALRRGAILALKGLGGYQLLVRGDDEEAVMRLRRRKRRPAKPFALLVPGLEGAKALAHVSDEEREALEHPAAAIVLLRRREGEVAPSVAPGLGRLGLMLPATPLHALIARQVGAPLVCTSGNLHDEPICIGDGDARCRLGQVADLFLMHDREILRRADDSVVQVVSGRTRVLRAARGLRPSSIEMPGAREPILALGGHLKQAAVLAVEGRAVLWPQLGDLDAPRARDAMAGAIEDLESFLGRRAEAVVVDRHPDYATSLWARQSGRELVQVQHHHAHLAAVLAEHGVSSALGVAWDGTGHGSDGTVWGGELLRVDGNGARRLGHLRPFSLPGGEVAARDGRRALVGLLASAELELPAEQPELGPLAALARSSRLSPKSTSVGRLFDGVAALCGVASRSRYEGEAAMALEALAEPNAEPYDLRWQDDVFDWRPMLAAMMAERDDAVRVASRFHATLVAMIVSMAERHLASAFALSGGCFQNALLLEQATDALGERGISVLAGERVPCGDGGLALGQAWAACAEGASCV